MRRMAADERDGPEGLLAEDDEVVNVNECIACELHFRLTLQKAANDFSCGTWRAMLRLGHRGRRVELQSVAHPKAVLQDIFRMSYGRTALLHAWPPCPLPQA